MNQNLQTVRLLPCHRRETVTVTLAIPLRSHLTRMSRTNLHVAVCNDFNLAWPANRFVENDTCL